MTMARMTVAKLAVMVSGLEARMTAAERAVLGGTKLTPTRSEQQLVATVSELGARIQKVEAVLVEMVEGAEKEAAEQGGVIIRHTSRAVLSADPAVPDLAGLQQCFAHYRLPAGVARGQVRVARITGQGTKGRGYANLRVELNGDEGWADALWLVVMNAPFDRGGKPDTWGLGT
jgi:hypothetical protein